MVVTLIFISTHNSKIFPITSWITGFTKPVKIGEISSEADAFLEANQLTEWAYITAYNPWSRTLPEAENEARNLRLLEQLKTYRVLDGEGKGSEGDWPGEKSFFVAGITRTEAIRLAQKFEQNAIVVGKRNEPAELVVTG